MSLCESITFFTFTSTGTLFPETGWTRLACVLYESDSDRANAANS